MSNGSISYLIESIARKIVLIQGSRLSKKQTELLAEILDTDIAEIQALLKRLKSLSNKEINPLL